MQILECTHPILRQKAVLVTMFDDELWNVCEEMFKLMKVQDGVGLAAPQVGISKRLFVADIGISDIAFINPKIVSAEGIQRTEEGCLSFPNVFVKTARAKTIELKFQDREGNDRYVKASGFPAVVLQHEMDHLDGILLLDWKVDQDFLGKTS